MGSKILVESFGWVYLVIVLDWYTKKLVGYHVGLQSTSRHWLMALDMAVNQQFPEGARGHGVNLMSDNGCQPTSVAFMAACNRLDVHQAFTSYNNPRGNADTERMVRTIKEELLWLREWTSPFELGRRSKRGSNGTTPSTCTRPWVTKVRFNADCRSKTATRLS